MARLTTFSKLLIVAAIVVGAFFAFRYFTSNSNQPEISTEKTDISSPEKESPAKVDQEHTSRSSASFTYTPPAPLNGKLKGVVELGASGFNSFIINVDAKKNWKLDKAEFGSSLVHENMATEEDVRSGLKKYIAQMLDYGVVPNDIHFVVSSSAAKSPEVVKIQAGLKSLKYVVNTVNATQEGQYALKATLPKVYEGNAFVVDIGSGNTKVSWLENGTMKSIESYGSKYYQNGTNSETVYAAIKAIAAKVPSSKAKTCFIIGGAPFELAKTHRNEKERYTVLKAPGAYELKGEKVQAGLNIYKALADGSGCDTFVFDWDSNFTIGFLLSL